MSPYNLRSRKVVEVIVSKEGKVGAKNSKAVPPKVKGNANRVRAPNKTAATVPEVQVGVEVEEQQHCNKEKRTRQRRIVKQTKGDDVQTNKEAKTSDLTEGKPLRRGLAREAKTNPRNCRTKPVSTKPDKANPKIDKINRKKQLNEKKHNGDIQETVDSEIIICPVKTTPNKAKEKKQRVPKCGKNNLKTGGKDKAVHQEHSIQNSHDLHKVTSGDPDLINVSRNKLRRKSIHKISKSSTTVRSRARKSLSLLITPRNSIKTKKVAVGVVRRISKCKVVATRLQSRSHLNNGATRVLRSIDLGSYKIIRDSLGLYAVGFPPDKSNVTTSDDDTDSEVDVTSLAWMEEPLESSTESAFTTALSSSSMFANHSSYDITAYEDHLKQDDDYRDTKRIPGWAKDEDELNLSLFIQNRVLESISSSPFPPNRSKKMF